ncbi:MAG: septation protein IspZ [Bacteroidota bacterium]|nr:septation protein IspZ [Bacteroidota bacterium]
MLPGFIPLFVFIAADEIWGTEVGLIVALVTGIFELGYWWIKDKKIDRFILFDTALLLTLGGVSLLLHDDVFFKLKPGFIGIIFCLILGLSAFSGLDIIGGMTKRYLRDIEFNDAQYQEMRKSMKVLFFIFTFHTILVFYAALCLSKEAWGFISGILFYLLIFGYMAFEIIRKKIFAYRYAHEEWLPLVNEEGNLVGQSPRSLCHKGKSMLHPVIHLHVIKNDRIYLQKRPMNKLVQPGKWDTAVGGHISLGEKLETALGREAKEEIGLTDFSAKLITRYQWSTAIEAELVYLFITHDAKNIVGPVSDEVEDGRFWNSEEIEKSFGKDVFTPNFELEYHMLKERNLI